MDDREIIRRVKRGDIEIFRLLVERYQQPLISFARAITRNAVLAEDACQTVFLAFYQNIERFDEQQKIPVSAWLYAATRNQAINLVKKEQRYVHNDTHSALELDTNSDPLDLLIRQEDRRLLLQCLELLDEPFKSTLLESLGGYSIKEISKKTLVLPGTVKSRLARARHKLALLLPKL